MCLVSLVSGESGELGVSGESGELGVSGELVSLVSGESVS